MEVERKRRLAAVALALTIEDEEYLTVTSWPRNAPFPGLGVSVFVPLINACASDAPAANYVGAESADSAGPSKRVAVACLVRDRRRRPASMPLGHSRDEANRRKATGANNDRERNRSRSGPSRTISRARFLFDGRGLKLLLCLRLFYLQFRPARIYGDAPGPAGGARRHGLRSYCRPVRRAIRWGRAPLGGRGRD
ncbi:hypothetical protein HPB47_005838, partial [Ixodes persulcatus]